MDYKILIPLAGVILGWALGSLSGFFKTRNENKRLFTIVICCTLLFDIDRDATRTYGLSTAQVAGALRTALFGKEVSTYTEGDEDYPIMLRLETEQRYDLETLKID